jgi:hypothetical protein
MNKLFERHPTRETTKLLPETTEVLPELPDHVTVPDDISGLTHPVATGDRRPASGVRWMYWLPIVVFLAAGAVVTAVALQSDNSNTPVQDEAPWTYATAGPGSNTLAPTAMEIQVATPWIYVTEGPGSNTLTP